MNDELRLAAASAVAREAGAVALAYYRGRDSLTVERKGPQDVVSIADRAVEERVRLRLGELFPEDGVLGEEGGLEAQGDGGTWVVDPIDGTWCFLNGIDSWCISLAFLRDGEIIIGVIYQPCTGELFAARRGGGATLDGHPIRVASARGLAEGTVSVGYMVRAPHALALGMLERLLAAGGIYHRHGSGSLGLAWTAAGRLIGYVEPHMFAWDALAGLLLIREAGGFTNDFLAGNGLIDGNRVVAGPPQLRAALETVAGFRA
jgi:myo-inositol-1(or 4)-monophosphatase